MCFVVFILSAHRNHLDNLKWIHKPEKLDHFAFIHPNNL